MTGSNDGYLLWLNIVPGDPEPFIVIIPRSSRARGPGGELWYCLRVHCQYSSQPCHGEIGHTLQIPGRLATLLYLKYLVNIGYKYKFDSWSPDLWLLKFWLRPKLLSCVENIALKFVYFEHFVKARTLSPWSSFSSQIKKTYSKLRVFRLKRSQQHSSVYYEIKLVNKRSQGQAKNKDRNLWFELGRWNTYRQFNGGSRFELAIGCPATSEFIKIGPRFINK